VNPSKKGVTVLAQPLLHLGRRLVGERAVRVVVGLHQVGGHRRGEDDAAKALLAVLGDVAGDLAAAHREADQGDISHLPRK
jgi:glyoxylate utilization-related uncharacterized protein